MGHYDEDPCPWDWERMRHSSAAKLINIQPRAMPKQRVVFPINAVYGDNDRVSTRHFAYTCLCLRGDTVVFAPIRNDLPYVQVRESRHLAVALRVTGNTVTAKSMFSGNTLFYLVGGKDRITVGLFVCQMRRFLVGTHERVTYASPIVPFASVNSTKPLPWNKVLVKGWPTPRKRKRVPLQRGQRSLLAYFARV